MSVGNILRNVLGPKRFTFVARYYRLIFVDLEKVAGVFAAVLPPNAHVIDVGGGDGEGINHLIRLRTDLQITMIDIAENIGNSITSGQHERVRILPKTSVREYTENFMESFDAIVVGDVIHHIPSVDRLSFFQDILHLCTRNNKPVMVIIKDIETKGVISFLGYLSDRYVSNDRHVKFVSQKDLIAQLVTVFPQATFYDTHLSRMNYPNYVFYFLT